jgi:hypothetical protein
MKTLVAELRSMTGVGEDQYESAGVMRWSDAELEAKLLQRISARLVQARIELIPTIGELGGMVFLNGEVRFEGTLDVEEASVVSFWGGPINGDFTVSPNGFVEFTESQISTSPLLSGIAYDLNGAAADVLTDWASAVKLGYDITTDAQTLTRSQRHAQILEQAENFRKRATIGSVQLVRRDVKGGGGGGHRTKAIEDSFDKWGLYPPRSK